jgi:hypothetical protein
MGHASPCDGLLWFTRRLHYVERVIDPQLEELNQNGASILVKS